MTAQVLSTNNQQGSTAPILSRNVPEPTSYTGKYYIKLPFKEEEYFAPTKTEAPDYALQFNGSNGYVEMKPSEKLAVTGDLTICAWVRIDEPNHGLLAIVGKHDGARPGPYALGLNSNGNPVFSLRGSDSVSGSVHHRG